MRNLEKLNLIPEFEETIETFNLIEKNDKILISYSGGPDSTFLTLSLLKIKEKYNLTLSIFYLNHRLPGSLDSRKVEEFAANFGLKSYVYEEDIVKFSKENKLNIEEAGRIKRYSLLEEISLKDGYNKIATAHTLNDALESYIIRFLREGLSLLSPPIKPKFKKIIRPLILIPREKILRFLKENDIPYHLDIENYDLRRTRNKIRHILVPILFREFNYNLEKFKKFYLRALEESEFYERKVKSEVKSVIEEENPLYLKINREKILKLDSFEKREVLKNIYYDFCPENELTRETLFKMEKILENGGKIEVRKNVYFISKKNLVLFLRKIPYFEIPLKEGEFEIEGLKIKIKISEDREKGGLPRSLLSEAKLRLRKKGDFIETEKGKKLKLKKFFENKKVPFYLRDNLVVLEYKGNIVWVEGFEPFMKGGNIKIEVLKWI
ncbi:MAG: tRNA lysidine(34) synthetase TilS [Candidatus Hydrothermales bacterium]